MEHNETLVDEFSGEATRRHRPTSPTCCKLLPCRAT